MPRLLTTIKRFIGDSSESKAQDAPNGSTFLEEDTGDIYIWSRDSWKLKSEGNIALRLETIKRDEALLGELKKVNENLLLVIEALDG